MESRFVKVASRFFLVEEDNGGGDDDGDYHYLDSCFLCKRDITFNRHIFMYRGDAAFCSDDCRQDQMDMDAALAAVARRHRTLKRMSSSTTPSPTPATPCSSNEAAAAGLVVIARRPTVSDLTTHAAPAVSG
ncbi:hypothetical protein ABZP36_023640 [Zizania latifolia]